MYAVTAEVRYQLGMAWVTFRYWIRPFDMIADRRRWLWQRRTPCGRAWLAGLPATQRAALEAALLRMLDRRDDTGRGGAT